MLLITEARTVQKKAQNEDLVVTKQTSISNSFKEISSFAEGGAKHRRITNIILFMICKDNLPLSTVEKESFKQLMTTVAPLYKVPSRKHFTNFLDQKYEFLKHKFHGKIERADYVALTTDIWTDSQTRSFLGITVHFLDGFNMKSGTFGVYQLDERHTAQYVSE
jgi:hypothetical protein